MNQTFFADTMLGRLARWMRIMGYNVSYDRKIDDNELIKKAVTEKRIVLTRDTLLIKRRALKGRYLFINGDDYIDQVRQVLARFRIDVSKTLTRCLICNTLLEDISKSEVKTKVPPYVYNTQDSFNICPDCGRIYWSGTHKDKIQRKLAFIMHGANNT
jgi:hypothetical protein